MNGWYLLGSVFILLFLSAIAGQLYVYAMLKRANIRTDIEIPDMLQEAYDKGFRNGVQKGERNTSAVMQEAQPYAMRASIERDVLSWSKRTFPDQTAKSIMLHLWEETEELNREVMFYTNDSEDKQDMSLAIADVYILLITLADYYDIDVYHAVDGKHNVNIGRYWKYDEELQYHKHIKEHRANNES